MAIEWYYWLRILEPWLSKPCGRPTICSYTWRIWTNEAMISVNLLFPQRLGGHKKRFDNADSWLIGGLVYWGSTIAPQQPYNCDVNAK